jgi:Tol biopolymer transport system component
VSHAPDYGIVPSLAPDGHRLVYNVLPPDTPIPGPDAAAQLWLADARTTDHPALLASNVDLLVPAVWSRDGSNVVFRRSGGKADGTYQLVTVSVSGGSQTVVVSSAGDALFPIGYSADAGRFYFVRLRDDGSYFSSLDIASGAETQIAQLSDGLTRDWDLSPDGGRLAYLAIDLGASDATSHAKVLDIASGAVESVGMAGSDAFSPRWDAAGNLVLGQLADGAASTAAEVIGQGSTLTLAAPQRGFDVPLAIDAHGGGIAVRSFDGASTANPGRAVLTVIDKYGARHEIAAGEVTFLGWIKP